MLIHHQLVNWPSRRTSMSTILYQHLGERNHKWHRRERWSGRTRAWWYLHINLWKHKLRESLELEIHQVALYPSRELDLAPSTTHTSQVCAPTSLNLLSSHTLAPPTFCLGSFASLPLYAFGEFCTELDLDNGGLSRDQN